MNGCNRVQNHVDEVQFFFTPVSTISISESVHSMFFCFQLMVELLLVCSARRLWQSMVHSSSPISTRYSILRLCAAKLVSASRDFVQRRQNCGRRRWLRCHRTMLLLVSNCHMRASLDLFKVYTYIVGSFCFFILCNFSQAILLILFHVSFPKLYIVLVVQQRLQITVFPCSSDSKHGQFSLGHCICACTPWHIHQLVKRFLVLVGMRKFVFLFVS